MKKAAAGRPNGPKIHQAMMPLSGSNKIISQKNDLSALTAPLSVCVYNENKG
jgi:hypothetical protein